MIVSLEVMKMANAVNTIGVLTSGGDARNEYCNSCGCTYGIGKGIKVIGIVGGYSGLRRGYGRDDWQQCIRFYTGAVLFFIQADALSLLPGWACKGS